MKTKLLTIFISLVLAIFTTNILEEKTLPYILKLKHTFLGNSSFSTALKGCENLNENEWIHPATLALTVYGNAQNSLKTYNKNNLPETLPNYSKNIKSDKEFLCVANYLLKNSKTFTKNNIKYRYVDYPIEKKIYNISKPWVSGLAQSFIGQVFLGAYVLTNDKKFLLASKETANFLFINVEEGGVLVELDENSYWFEEYAEKNSESPLVLNGHIIVLDYLYILNSMFKNDNWSELFDKGFNALIKNIDRFVGINWSYYDTQGNFANGKYHRFHIRQLKRYEVFDKSNKLKEARLHMEQNLKYPLGTLERLITQPSKLLVFLVTMYTILYYILIILLKFIFRKVNL